MSKRDTLKFDAGWVVDDHEKLHREERRVKDYGVPDPAVLERVRLASDDELQRYLTNARRKLPETQWLVNAIAQEQVKRGGLLNLSATSVRQVILRYAQAGRTCTYKEIAEALGVRWEQAHWRLPRLLGEVSEGEHAAGRPLLTAIVTSKKGVCGDGFFTLAERNGFHVTHRQAFQDAEQKRVFTYWRSRRSEPAR